MLERSASERKGIVFLFKIKSLKTLISFEIKCEGMPGFTGNSYILLIFDNDLLPSVELKPKSLFSLSYQMEVSHEFLRMERLKLLR